MKRSRPIPTTFDPAAWTATARESAVALRSLVLFGTRRGAPAKRGRNRASGAALSLYEQGRVGLGRRAEAARRGRAVARSAAGRTAASRTRAKKSARLAARLDARFDNLPGCRAPSAR